MPARYEDIETSALLANPNPMGASKGVVALIAVVGCIAVGLTAVTADRAFAGRTALYAPVAQSTTVVRPSTLARGPMATNAVPMGQQRSQAVMNEAQGSIEAPPTRMAMNDQGHSSVFAPLSLLSVALVGLAALFRTITNQKSESSSIPDQFIMAAAGGEIYSMPDQPARFAKAKAENNERFLNIESVYDPAWIKGKRVGITGANRGIGLALATELTAVGAKVIAINRSDSAELQALKPEETITGVDVTSDTNCNTLGEKVKGGPLDVLINNAGYFYEPVEKMDSLNFAEELKMIDICALGPLRITSALYNAGLLAEGCKVAMITSQGGSVGWRTTQNPDGGDYGHHMSKAAANMMGVLVSQEFKKKNIPVGIIHPGFNKTEMTAKYAEIWEVEGAVDPAVGAKRVVHEIGNINMETTGLFINAEDGLQIPW